MTKVNIENEETKDVTFRTGDFFTYNNELYQIVDTENNENTSFEFDIIKVKTGEGLYNNDLNIDREDYIDLDFINDKLHYFVGIRKVKEISIKF